MRREESGDVEDESNEDEAALEETIVLPDHLQAMVDLAMKNLIEETGED